MERAILASLIIVCLLSATSALIIKQANSSETTYIDETYGGVDYDEAWFLVQTVDGGYALVGNTFSFGAGASDFWLVKTDASGNHEWNQTYGGPNDDYARSLMQTVDGGYVLVGYTSSFGAGSSDFWLVKTDVSGNHEWNYTYGGLDVEGALSLVQTVDGGYALAGGTNPYGAFSSSDILFVKTDASGNHEWNKTYGGPNADFARSVVQTVDGGYALAGYTRSFGAGDVDFWLVKTDEFGIIPEFPAWTLFLAVIVFTVTIIFYRRKLLKITNH